MTSIQNAFSAEPGTIVKVERNEWDQAANLIDGGICQMTTVNGVRVLEVL